MEFLRLLPAWLLVEVQNCEPSAASDGDLLEESPVAALAWCHLSLWSGANVSYETVRACMAPFRVSCALEHNRRCGLIRIQVEGDDRLDAPEAQQRMAVELSPLLIEALSEVGHAPTPAELNSIMQSVLPRALESDWADPDALR